MSRSEGAGARKAVALQYGSGDGAPVVVASGMGYMAEKIVEVAADSGVPIYEDNSLATVLTQLKLGQEIPEELYQAIVEIYVYFLQFDPQTGKSARKGQPQGEQALSEAPSSEEGTVREEAAP